MQPAGQVLGQGGPVIVQEQGVVGEGGHGDPDLAQVVQVLQDGDLSQQQPVGDTLGHHEPGHQMLYGASLTAMGSKDKSVETPLGPEVVEDRHVGVHVVQVVGVGRVLVVGPLLGDGHVAIKKGVFGFAFIIYGVEADDVPKIKVGYDAYFCFGYDKIGRDWTNLDKSGQVWTSLDKLNQKGGF